MSDSMTKEDLKFLLSFVPARSTDQVVEGLGPMFYQTKSYEGDLALAQRVEDIIARHGIEVDDLDSEEDLSEE